MNVKYNVDTKVIYNIGDPLDHSIAPFLFSKVYQYMNLNAVNLAAVIPRGKLAGFIQAARTLGCPGADLTSPHKRDIIPFLDECEPAAKAFGCVNTVKIKGDKLIGIGLDGSGLSLAVQNRLGPVGDRRALVLGAGPVAGLAAHELCLSGVSHISIANRTVEKARDIAETIESMHGVPCAYGPLEDAFLSETAKKAGIALQCTSLGRKGEAGLASYGFVSGLPADCFAVDVLYPETQFLAACARHNLKSLNGLCMMLYQQIPKIKFHFGVDVPQTAIPAFEEAAEVAVTLIRFRKSMPRQG
jgi:shikimate dehydrogenase